jgi:hypothetical protein
MSEEEKGFTVKDRRAFSAEGDMREDAAEETDAPQTEPREAEGQGADQPETGTGAAEGGAEKQHRLPPVDFSSFILSMSSAALMHLGQIPDPQSGKRRQDLALARHTIDTLGMIQDKTKGNLSDEEQKLIDSVLTDLRLAFVQLNK